MLGLLGGLATLFLLHLAPEVCQAGELAEGGRPGRRLLFWLLLLLEVAYGLFALALLLALFLLLFLALFLALGLFLGRLAEDNVFLVLVEANHTELQLVALVVVVAEFLRAVLQFAARHKGLHVERELHHEALVLHAHNLALCVVAFLVGIRKLVPRVGLHLLVAQRNAAPVLVNVEDHDVELLPLVDHVARVANFLGPGQVRDVHEPVDARLNLDKDTEVGDVAHRAGQHRARRVAVADALPRVGLQLLHAKRDLSLFLVDVQDLDIDDLSQRDHLTGMLNVACP